MTETEDRQTAADALVDGLTEERYRRLVDLSPDAICVHEAGIVVYVNAAGVRWMAAASAEQIIGHSITEFVDPDSVPPMLGRISTLFEVGDASEPSEARMVRFDGTTLTVEAVSVLTQWEGRVAYQVIFRDLSAQKSAEATLRHQAALINHVSDAIISTTATGLVSSWNPAAHAIYGLSAEQAMDLPIAEVVSADLDPAAIIGVGGVVHATHYAAHGAVRYMRVSVAAMDSGYVLVCSDLTALRRAERHFEVVVQSLEGGVVVTASDGSVKFVNPAARRILGLEAAHFANDFATRAREFPLYDEDGNLIPLDERPLLTVTGTGESFSNRVFGFDHVDGSRGWLRCSCQLLSPDDTLHSDALTSFTDITTERVATQQLAHEATHDPLTGLPNRAFVLKRITQAVESDGDAPLRAVLYIDIDGLKSINDTLGHHAGDDLLRVAAERLSAPADPTQLAGRLGGDEFIVLIFGAASSRSLGAIASMLHDVLAEPVEIANVLMPIRASIGMVEVKPGDTRSATDILRDADLAMYQTKRARRDKFQL